MYHYNIPCHYISLLLKNYSHILLCHTPEKYESYWMRDILNFDTVRPPKKQPSI